MTAASARGLFRATGKQGKPVAVRAGVDLAGQFEREIEIWRAIEGWPGYEVSNMGRVRSWKWPSANRQWVPNYEREPRILRPAPRNGYLAVGLADKQRGQVQHNIHRLVLEAFVGTAPSERHQGAHGDGDIKNNRLSNLSWKTPVENNADKIIHGTHQYGDRIGTARLKNEQADEIRLRRANGERVVDLAREFEIGLSTAKKIIAGKTYRAPVGMSA